MSPSILLFTRTLIISILIIVSSDRIFISWVALELNSLSFIPMIFLANSRRRTKFLGEAALKYFLVQTFGSVVLITVCLLSSLNFLSLTLSTEMIIIALLIKLGVAPFHSWRVRVGAGISWSAFFVLITIQKLNPFLIIVSLPHEGTILLVAVGLTLAVGAFGGLVQTDFKSLLIYSSINHLGWIAVASTIRLELLMLYIFIYALALYVPVVVADINIIDEVVEAANHEEPILHQCLIGARILSLAGLPPFLGFLPKWLVLQDLVIRGNTLIPFIIILCRVLILYFYLRVGFSTFVLATLPDDWEDEEDEVDFTEFYHLFTVSIVLTCGGLPLVFLL